MQFPLLQAKYLQTEKQSISERRPPTCEEQETFANCFALEWCFLSHTKKKDTTSLWINMLIFILLKYQPIQF